MYKHTTKMGLIKHTTLATMLAAATTASPQEGTPEQNSSFYLNCPAANEPDGVNDIYIDLKTRTLTDFFGNTRPFKEEGPFIISESYTEEGKNPTPTMTIRINRHTLTYQFLWPARKIEKTLKCKIIQKRL